MVSTSTGFCSDWLRSMDTSCCRTAGVMTVPRATSPRTSLSRRMMRGTSAAGPLIASSFPRTWKSTAGYWFSMNRRASSWLPSDWTICSESSNKTTSVRNPGREWGNSPAVRSPALNRALPFAASVMVLARGPLVPSSMNMVSPPVIPTDGGTHRPRPGSPGPSILRQRGAPDAGQGPRRPRAGPVGCAPSTRRYRQASPTTTHPSSQCAPVTGNDCSAISAATHPDAVPEIMYQLRIGLISFPLQFRRAPPNRTFAPGLCAMLEFGCPPGLRAGRPAGQERAATGGPCRPQNGSSPPGVAWYTKGQQHQAA